MKQKIYKHTTYACHECHKITSSSNPDIVKIGLCKNCRIRKLSEQTAKPAFEEKPNETAINDESQSPANL